MSAGTITLTNNSDTVTGSGTAFTSELTVGDFIVATVGGIPYTLPIKTVDSNTSLTLVSNYTGPTQGGAAWYAVPRVAMNLVTAALVAQSAEALRGLNYDKQNWQQVYSAAGNIIVNLPDGTTFTGPSWKYITDLLKNSELVGRDSIGTSGAKIPLLSTANTWSSSQDFNGTVSQWTTPASPSPGAYINSAGLHTGLRGRGARMDSTGGLAAFYYQEQVGVKVSAIINLNSYDNDRSWVFEQNGNAIAPGSWSPNSDDRLKTNKERIQNPLSLMKELGGYTWTRLDGGAWGIGFIAQEVAKIFPEAVQETGDRTLDDGTVVEGVLSPDTYGVAAALHHEAILALLARIEVLEAKLKDK